MSERKIPTLVTHFTHVRNLPGIASEGMHSDATCREQRLTQVEIGDLSIRERRLHLPVDAGAHGFVGDYVPFYFGPLSPMMFVLRKNDDEFRADCDGGDIIYLVTSVEAVNEARLEWVASNRNAALDLAEFVDDLDQLDVHVSWDVIRARYWGDFVDGKDRRMAEFLVHRSVPWHAIGAIVVRNARAKSAVEAALSGLEHQPEVSVRPGWYF